MLSFAAALSSLAPPPPPRLPLEGGTPSCQSLDLPPKSKAVFSVFGGSNTQGANAVSLNARGGTNYGRANPSFARLLADRLRDTHIAKWNADGGSGPLLAGTCASLFIPPDTRLGTIEYLPNLGYIHEDQAEVGSIKAMLHMLHARGAFAFVVNIVSGRKRFENEARGSRQASQCIRLNFSENVVGCTGRDRLFAFRDKLALAANATGAHVVTIDADEVPHLFGADSFHLNAEGHRTVFNSIWRIYRSLPCMARHDRAARTQISEEAGVSCALGDELAPLVGEAAGFERTDLQPGRVEKVGWAARQPNASLKFCIRLPRKEKEAHEAELKNRIFLNSKDAMKIPLTAGFPYRISVGLQASHPRNHPLFGVAQVDCTGSCNCMCADAPRSKPGCRFDTLSNTSAVTITTYLNLKVSEADPAVPALAAQAGCPADACVLQVRNAADNLSAASDGHGERSKVVVRALIVGLSDFRTLHMMGLRNAAMNNARRE